MRTTSLLLLVSVIALLASPPPASAGADMSRSSLEVKDLEVEFLKGNRIRVRGRLKCTGLAQDEGEQAWSSVRIDVDFPDPERGFGILAEEWWGKETSVLHRDDVEVSWFYRGAFHDVDSTKLFFFSNALRPDPGIFDEHLDDARDEGRWIAFDRTLDFNGVLAKDRERYRVLIGWTLHTSNLRFIHYYQWVEYGPFPWGEAPAVDKTLRSTFRRPTSFTKKGVVTPEAVEPPDTHGQDGTGEAGEGDKPPVPKRSGRRPNQGEAVDLCNDLGKRLEAWSAVAHAQAMANPRQAVLAVTTTADVPAADLAALVARIAAETAAALDWIQSVELTLEGAHGTSKIGLTWDAIVAYANETTTLAEFYDTWTCEGAAIPRPPEKT